MAAFIYYTNNENVRFWVKLYHKEVEIYVMGHKNNDDIMNVKEFDFGGSCLLLKRN